MKKTDAEIVTKKNHDELVAKYGLAYWNNKEYRNNLSKRLISEMLKENVK